METVELMGTVEFGFVVEGIEEGDVVSFGGKKYLCKYVKKTEGKMPKYRTKKIDYTGCHPVIAKHLKKGEAILCNVRNDTTELRKYIIGYDSSLVGKYMSSMASHWKHAEPIETKTRVKRASEIIKWFEDRGVLNPDNGIWDDGDPEGWAFLPIMFRYCGMVPSKDYNWHPDWIEEVDE